jgi:hypothetical protein
VSHDDLTVIAAASVVIVWLAIVAVNCPPEASDCI